MGTVFVSLLEGYGKSWLPAKSIVAKAFDNRFEVDKSGEILVLDQFCPWKEHLYNIEKENNAEGLIKFVLFKDSSGNGEYQQFPSPQPLLNLDWDFHKN